MALPPSHPQAAITQRGIKMRISFRQTVIATTAIAGLSAFAASAAPPAAGDPTAVRPSPTTGAQTTSPAQPDAGHNMAVKIEQRITDLHARLQISAAQQPQWSQFAQVMRDNAQSMDLAFQQRVDAIPTMTAAQNMQSYAQVATDHAQDMQKLVPAFQALYDTMSDNQKHTADQVFRADAHHSDQARHG
jgi:protein CpxP